jgi:AbrB family looped-hinge helix DNA binding protein
MNTTVRLDKAGRIVIPKAMRDELRLEPGDALALESEEGRVTLRPVRSSTRLRRERGVWVFPTGKYLPAAITDAALRDRRRECDPHNRRALLQKRAKRFPNHLTRGNLR